MINLINPTRGDVFRGAQIWKWGTQFNAIIVDGEGEWDVIYYQR